MTPNIPTRDVAGLRVPLPLVPRIIRAFRGAYPNLTAEIADDEAAVRAVLRDFVTSTLSIYESRRASEVVQEEIEEKRASLEGIANAAFQKARKDAASITDAVDAEPVPIDDPDEETPTPEPPAEPEPPIIRTDGTEE